MNLLKVYINTVSNKKLRNYPNRWVRGFIGLIKGYRSYNDKERACNLYAYVNYFIVKEIEGWKIN